MLLAFHMEEVQSWNLLWDFDKKEKGYKPKISASTHRLKLFTQYIEKNKYN